MAVAAAVVEVVVAPEQGVTEVGHAEAETQGEQMSRMDVSTPAVNERGSEVNSLEYNVASHGPY